MVKVAKSLSGFVKQKVRRVRIIKNRVAAEKVFISQLKRRAPYTLNDQIEFHYNFDDDHADNNNIEEDYNDEDHHDNYYENHHG